MLPKNFRIGSVALLSVVTKQAGRSTSAEALLGSLAEVANALADLIEKLGEALGNTGELRALHIGDTIALSCVVESTSIDEMESNSLALQCITTAVMKLLVTGATRSFPIAFKGAITLDALYHHDGFILGPAIEEAASMSEVPEGSIVGFGHSAMEFLESLMVSDNYKQLYDSFEEAVLSNKILFRYTVPTYKHGKISSYVVNPLASPELSRGEISVIASGIKKASRSRKTTPATRDNQYFDNTEKFVKFALLQLSAIAD